MTLKDMLTGSIRISVASLILLGCSSITPHENFKANLFRKIGKSWKELYPSQFPSEKDLISSKGLPNGNIEKRYKSMRSCIHIYEIDPKTDIIVGASFEGKDTDCVINP